MGADMAEVGGFVAAVAARSRRKGKRPQSAIGKPGAAGRGRLKTFWRPCLLVLGDPVLRAFASAAIDAAADIGEDFSASLR